MHEVHFWGQERSYLSDQRVPYLWLKERGRERGNRASALGRNMDTQGLLCFAHIQTECAAYSTFHFCSSVPVRHSDSYLSVCLTTAVFKCPPISLLLYNINIPICSNGPKTGHLKSGFLLFWFSKGLTIPNTDFLSCNWTAIGKPDQHVWILNVKSCMISLTI